MSNAHDEPTLVELGLDSPVPQSVIAEVAPVKSCPYCQTDVPKSSHYCRNCGNAITHSARRVDAVDHAEASARHHRILSVIPGLGHIAKGQPVNGAAWFLLVIAGYACFVVPGIVLHVCCFYTAGKETSSH